MKKLLILNYEFPPLGGGGGRVSFSLAKGFKQKGYDVDVITSRYDELPRFEIVDGINIHRVSIWGRKKKQTATFLSMFFFLFTASLCGIKLCTKNRYRFISTHFVLPTGPLGFFLSKFFHLKNILTLLGGDIYDPSKKSSPHNSFYMRWIVKLLLNQANQVIALSSNIKQNANRYYKPRKEINIIPHCYVQFKFTPVSRMDLGLKRDKNYIISVGRVVKRKGFDYLIRSLKLLNDDVELFIVGDGNEKAQLIDLARELCLIDRVHFLGDISEELKFQYLSNSDIYVLSSLHEGLGIVLQEAMQVGLPIVSTNHGGQVDIVAHNTNGLLVKPCDVEALADAINVLLTDNIMYQNISVNNKEALSKFRTDNIINRYLELI